MTPHTRAARLAEQAAGQATGLACAAAAGLCWGLIFLVPLLLPEYPAMLLAAGRYTAFGLVACVLAWPARRALRQLNRASWVEAARLSAVGNIVYYSCVAAAVQLAGGPLTTVIIGTLPVSIALVANASDRDLPWRRLLPSLVMIALGIGLVGHDALHQSVPTVGAALAFTAVGCWTLYAVRNARWMKQHRHVSASTWTTAQGLMTLPLAVFTWGAIGFSGAAIPSEPGAPGAVGLLGPQPGAFLLWMLTLGLLASWVGTQLWSVASRRLPVPLMGQLIVCETLSGLAYVYVWRGAWPDAGVGLGIALLVGGVALAVRAAYNQPAQQNGSA